VLRSSTISGRSTITFSTRFTDIKGKPWEVVQELGSHGCEISRESEKTRRSKALMRHRDVEYCGRILRCEWHSKLRPDKNRIHFAKLDDQAVFIGIFVKHLPT
jgi:hypothetical protein